MIKTVIQGSLRKVGYSLVPNRFNPFTHAARDLDAALGRDVRVVFDIGANVGQTATGYRTLFPKAKIYSFEPFPESFAQLAGLGLRDFEAIQAAVSSDAGSARLFVSKHSEMNSLLEVGVDGPTHMGGDNATVVGEVDVKTITLDDFCRDRKIDRIDLLKMDVQGAELKVLKGADSLIRRKAIRCVYTEVLFAETYRDCTWFDELWRHMRSVGYTLHGLYNLTHGTDGRLGWGDAIFVAG